MKIVCISASNTAYMGENSASTRVCRLIMKNVSSKIPEASVRIIPLMNQKISFCLLCGDCSENGLCPYDESFNYIFSHLKSADIIFFVVPHYAPLPSKLLALFEKIHEILYGSLIKIPQFESPFENTYALVIGHGDLVESRETLNYYHEAVIRPVANTLASFGCEIIGYSKEYPEGMPFGLMDETCIQFSGDSVFPGFIHNWDIIEERINTLVDNLVSAVKVRAVNQI